MSKPATKFAPGSGISDKTSRQTSSKPAPQDEEFQQLQRIATYMRDLIVELDVQGRLKYVSPSSVEMLGYSPDEIAGHSVFPYLHPEDVSKLHIPQEKSFIPNPGPLHIRARHRDGRWISLEVEGRLIRAGDRTVTGALVAARDITERTRVEAALHQSERRYRDLVDNTEDYVFSLDLNCRVTMANRSICRALGLSEKDMLGLALHDLTAPHELVHTLERLHRKVVKEGRTAEGEARLHDGAGQSRMYRFTVYPIRADQGDITGVAGLCKDITTQLQAIENIKYLTFHDKLTGLYNRAYFEEEIARQDTPRSLPLAIIIGDINGLKVANDVLGHAEGDRLLTNTASAIRSVLRREDVICRWGGDEFAIILPRTRADIAARVRDRVSSAVRTAAADPIPLSIALGMAVKLDPSQDMESVIREAENRMYRNKLLEGRSAHGAIVSFLQESLIKRTHEDQAHAARLEALMTALGTALDVGDKQLAKVADLASLHDVGKISIPKEVLDRPGPLSGEEWEAIRRHSEIGYRIAATSPDLAPIAEIILAHHERWDGTGYPQGLAGTNIPLMARILAVADAFDVMTHGRPYRSALGREEALAEIQQCSGSQFDPAVVQALAGLLAADVAF